MCRPDISFFAVERIFFNGGDEAFYHICTDGASLDWMFLDNYDFIAGVNRVAVCAFLSHLVKKCKNISKLTDKKRFKGCILQINVL